VTGHHGRQSPADPLPGIRDRALLTILSTLTFIFEQISIDRAVALGAKFGQAWYRLGGPRTRRVRDQLEAAFPEENVARRKTWAREVFIHLGRGLAELVLLRGRHRPALLDRVEIQGLEHVEAAERETSSGGVLIVTAHFGNWELACAKVAAIGIPLSVVYRGLSQPALDRAMLGLRDAGSDRPDGAAVIDQIPMGRAGIRLVRALEAGRKVVVLLDQDARREEGVFVSFFGRSASTRYGPIALATQRGVPILPVFVRRDPDGRTHRLQIQPALQLEPGSSDDEDVLRRNVQLAAAAIENEIRSCPGQWIWTHRRWRTQPGIVDRSGAHDRN
jgi:KDO2-lipid IV(A) lauroyltransferase